MTSLPSRHWREMAALLNTLQEQCITLDADPMAEYLPARIIIHPHRFTPSDETYCDRCGLPVEDQVHAVDPQIEDAEPVEDHEPTELAIRDTRVFWGHGPIEPSCAHARETRAGQPVADLAVDGSIVGFGICGCLLIADVAEQDVAPGAYRRCTRCVELLANRRPGVDYPLWTPE